MQATRKHAPPRKHNGTVQSKTPPILESPTFKDVEHSPKFPTLAVVGAGNNAHGELFAVSLLRYDGTKISVRNSHGGPL
jgi:hypothetical protein